MILINLGVGYLIVRLTNSYNLQAQGRIMILLGCLYMLVGLGSLAGRSKERYESGYNFSANMIREFHTNEIKRFDKNLVFTLHGALVGSITLIIGLLMYEH
jgi:hypothetical protein